MAYRPTRQDAEEIMSSLDAGDTAHYQPTRADALAASNNMPSHSGLFDDIKNLLGGTWEGVVDATKFLQPPKSYEQAMALKDFNGNPLVNYDVNKPVLSRLNNETASAKVGQLLGMLGASAPFFTEGGAALAAPEAATLLERLHLKPQAARLAFGSGAYQASQQPGDIQEKLKSFGEGALTGGVLGKGYELGGKLLKPVANYVAGKTVAPLVEKVEPLLKTLHQAASDVYSPLAQAVGHAYQAARHKVLDWEQTLMPLAREADQSGAPFANEHFVQTAKALQAKYAPKQARLPEKYGAADTILSDLIQHPPTSYEDATYLNEKLNDLPRTWQTNNDAEQQVLKKMSSQLLEGLKKQVGDNAQSSSASQRFFNEWLNQRANYKALKAFSQTPVGRFSNGQLKLTYNKRLADLIEGESTPEPDIAKHFMPTSRESGTLKMDHLTHLLGDKQQAQQALRSEYIRQWFSEGEFNPKQALADYQRLSPEQRAFIFNRDENDLLSSAVKAKRLDDRTRFLHRLGTHLGKARYGVAPAIGAGAGGLYEYHHGGSPESGMLLGGIAGLSVPIWVDTLARGLARRGAVDWLSRVSEQQRLPQKGVYPLGIAGNQALNYAHSFEQQ